MSEKTYSPETAAAHGVACCTTCGQLSLIPDSANLVACPRCKSPLHFRKPRAIERSWAYLISAYLLFGPAMMLPIMETGSLFGEQRDTIMSGILFLFKSGSWALAAIVFVASIFVPLAKLICLTYLLITIRRKKPHSVYTGHGSIESLSLWVAGPCSMSMWSRSYPFWFNLKALPIFIPCRALWPLVPWWS